MFSPFFLSLFLTDKCNILHYLKFDYQMAVYELYEYGDALVMNCYCVFSFLSVSALIDKCNILHEAEV